MYNSSDFMNYLHEDKVQRLRHNAHGGHGYKQSRLAGEMVESPFTRVRGAISDWVNGSRNRDTNPS